MRYATTFLEETTVPYPTLIQREIIAVSPGLVHHAEVAPDLNAFLAEQAERHGLTTLFAIADDGVIWGRYEAGGFVTSHEATAEHPARRVCPPLRALTLQEARLFGPQGECYCWRTAQGFQARTLLDQGGDIALWRRAFDEAHLLWGTLAEPLEHGFTLLTEGANGLRHAVPRAFSLPDRTQPGAVRLRVRHYLDPTSARVATSRLLDLECPTDPS